MDSPKGGESVRCETSEQLPVSSPETTSEAKLSIQTQSKAETSECPRENLRENLREDFRVQKKTASDSPL